MELKVSVGSLEIQTPLVGASGAFGSGIELARAGALEGLGALVLKTVTVEPREGNPPPRVAETPSGMLNSIGLENPGLERFVEHVLPESAKLRVPLVASVAGRTPEEYALCAERVAETGLVAAIELNLSCPNDRSESDGRGVLAFGQDPEAASRAVRAARSAASLPLWAKLTPNVTDIAAVGRSCEEAGADALIAVNTLLGIAVEVRSRRPVLSTVTGGLSGPALKPVALRAVWELSGAVTIPVIGCGGVESGEDVVAFLLVGASAVELGTAAIRDPGAPSRIARELGGLLSSCGAKSARELVGALETS